MKRYNLRNWLLATCKIDGIIEIGFKGTIYFFPSKLLPNGIHGDKNIVICQGSSYSPGRVMVIPPGVLE